MKPIFNQNDYDHENGYNKFYYKRLWQIGTLVAFNNYVWDECPAADSKDLFVLKRDVTQFGSTIITKLFRLN